MTELTTESAPGSANVAEGRFEPPTDREEVLVLDFGGQYSQLIARRIRECGVFAELLPHGVDLELIRARKPRALVLSGGPASVYEKGAPALRRELLELGIPVLGICYGMQLMVHDLGGRGRGRREGRVRPHGADPGRRRRQRCSPGLPPEQQCWMSPSRLRVSRRRPGSPRSPRARARRSPPARTPTRGLYGIQFHPEVVHTPHGQEILERFLRDVAGCEQRWTPASVIDEQVERIREQVGGGRRDLRPLRRRRLGHGRARSSTGDRRPAHLRASSTTACCARTRPTQVVATFREGLGIQLIHVDAEERFLARLAGARRPRDEAQDHRRGVHPGLRGGGPQARRTSATSCRARSTRT